MAKRSFVNVKKQSDINRTLQLECRSLVPTIAQKIRKKGRDGERQ